MNRYQSGPVTLVSPTARLLGFTVAVAGLSLASQAEIPLEPVPLTLQSLAVVLTGILLGPLLGFAATAAWLAGGAAGLPLFAGGEGGIGHLAGPTAGYLLSFPLAAALAGGLAGPASPMLRLFLAGIAAHSLILAVGGAWLSTLIGAGPAAERGVLPFIPGALLKSAIAAAMIRLIWRRKEAPPSPG